MNYNMSSEEGVAQYYADKALEMIEEGMQDTYSELLKPEFSVIKSLGEKLIFYYDAWKNNEIAILDSIRNPNPLYLKLKGNKKQQLELLAIEAFDNFQNAVNLYYGQIVILTYVYIDEKQNKAQLGNFINSIDNLGLNPQRRISYQRSQIENIFQWHEDQYDSQVLDKTFSEVYRRWKIAKSRVKVINKKEKIKAEKKGLKFTQMQGQGLPILWKEDGHWNGRLISNEGSIAEAYANFYLNKFTGFENIQLLDPNVKIYIIHDKYGVYAVDNASGFLVGDTSEFGQRYQFAVKKSNASVANMNEIINMIREITNEQQFQESIDAFKQNQEKVRTTTKGAHARNLTTAIKRSLSHLTDISIDTAEIKMGDLVLRNRLNKK